MQLITLIAMFFTAGAVAFALQNNVPITLTFLIWRFDSSLAIVLLLAIVIGGLIVALVSTPATLRRQWAIKRLRKQVSELEKTCNRQGDVIANLESKLPADTPSSESAPHYLGLKQIIFGRGNEGEEKSQSRD